MCWPGDQVPFDVGMETSVPVRLGVAAECAELLGMETSVTVKLGVATKCVVPATKCGSLSESERQFA